MYTLDVLILKIPKEEEKKIKTSVINECTI